MLQFCKDSNNGVGYIVVHDLSRFARNMWDQLSTEKELREKGVRLESVTEPGDDTAVGRWQRNMLAAWHQYDNDRRSERTVAGMTQAAKAGRFPFKGAVGYINLSQRRGHNLIQDAKTAPLIKKAFELFATGLYTKAEVLRQVTSLGLVTRAGRPMSLQTFQRLLVNPIYAGWVEIPTWGIKQQGGFEPIVSQQLFDAVQDVLAGRRAIARAYDRNNPDFPLRIFVRCGKCGTPMTGAWSSGKKQKYPYYRCRRARCESGNIRRDDLESKFVHLLKSLTPAPEMVAEFTDTVRTEWKRRQGDAEAASTAVQQRLAKLKQRKERLLDLRIDGDIDQQTYLERNSGLSADIEAVEVELRRVDAQFLDLEDVLCFAEKIVTSPARLWLESSLDQRQRLQQTFFPEGLTFDGEEFGTLASSSFFELLRGYL